MGNKSIFQSISFNLYGALEEKKNQNYRLTMHFLDNNFDLSYGLAVRGGNSNENMSKNLVLKKEPYEYIETLLTPFG